MPKNQPALNLEVWRSVKNELIEIVDCWAEELGIQTDEKYFTG